MTCCDLLWRDVQVVYQDEDEDDGPQPDPTLENGNGLPMRIKPDFPPELIGVPIEDIDPFYHNQRVRCCATFTTTNGWDSVPHLPQPTGEIVCHIYHNQRVGWCATFTTTNGWDGVPHLPQPTGGIVCHIYHNQRVR